MELGTLEIKIARSENLPALPQVVSAVLHLADDPNISARAVEQVIERDAAMAAKILRVANSSYYGTGQVASISRAVSVLGMNVLRSLVVSVAYQQIIGRGMSSSRFDRKQFWQHSLAAATTARILGKLKMPNKCEELYGAGMMHDIGLLILDKFAPEVLDQALASIQRDPRPLHAVLRSTVGYDHASLGASLAAKWNLSLATRTAIRSLFDPFNAEEHLEFTCTVALANHLADQAGYPNNSTVMDDGYCPELLSIVGVPEEQCGAIVAVVQAEVARAAAAFAIR